MASDLLYACRHQTRMTGEVTVMSEGKSVTMAVILSLIIPGLGHFYLGSIGKGFTFLILQIVGVALTSTIFGAIIGVPILIVMPIWAAIDANMAAKA